jgi:hypothetical protein
MNDTTLNIRVNEELKNKMQEVADSENRNVSNWILNLAQAEIQRYEIDKVRTWKVKDYGDITGRNIEAAVGGKLNDLARKSKNRDYKVDEIKGFKVEYSQSILGGNGGYEIKILASCSNLNNIKEPPFDEMITAWVYADKEGNPQ